MSFVYSPLRQYAGRAGIVALLLLIISLVAVGGMLVRGHSSPQDTFKMADATTTEGDGKRLKAKPGFELVVKGKNTVVARRHNSSVESVDKVECACSPVPKGGYGCYSGQEDNVHVCGTGESSKCCRWVHVK